MPINLGFTQVDRDPATTPARYTVIFQAGDAHYKYTSAAAGEESTLARANYATNDWEQFQTPGGAEAMLETVLRLKAGLGLPFAAFRAAYEFWEEGYRAGYAQGQADLITAAQVPLEF